MQNHEYNDKEMIYFVSQNLSIGTTAVKLLMDKYNPLYKLLDADVDELISFVKLKPKQAKDIIESKPYIDNIMVDYEYYQKRDIDIVTFIDDNYPKKLKEIKDPPACLYLKGDLPDNSTPAVSIVGSRAATNYGLNMARFISSELAKEGVAIISGMAVGIDSEAHRGALEVGGKSYAVLAGGVNVCYPKENYDIYEAMGEQKKGAVISESIPGSSPLRQFFPMRNRIISGLSDVLVVIEAREKSGSLITVDHALNQGKEIFVLPGRLSDPLSRGCNELIKNGASIITSPSDILDALNLKYNKKLDFTDKNINFLAKKEKVVYSCLNLEPKYAQDIVDETNLPLGEVMGVLLELELKGFITQLSGNYYAIKID